MYIAWCQLQPKIKKSGMILSLPYELERELSKIFIADVTKFERREGSHATKWKNKIENSI